MNAKLLIIKVFAWSDPDTQDNFYAAGSFNLSVRLEDSMLTSNGYSDGFLLKYNSNGKLLWARNFGTWYYDYARHLAIDNLGGVIITGSIGDTLTIDSLSVNPISAKNAALAIQFSPSGKATWAGCISGSGRNLSNSALIDSEGNLYLTGTFRNTFMKDNTNITSMGDQDVFLAKYYNCPTSRAEIFGDRLLCNGSSIQLTIKPGFSQVVWNDTIKNTNYIVVNKPGINTVRMRDTRGCLLSDTVKILPIQPSVFSLGKDTSLLMESSLLLLAPDKFTGYYWQDGSVDATFLATSEEQEPGKYTYWLSAIDSIGCIITDTIVIEFYAGSNQELLKKLKLTVYPNPVGELLYWSLNAEESCSFIVEITDDNGRILYNQQVKNYQPGTQMAINFSDMPYGSYYMRIKDDMGQSFNSVAIIRK